MTAQSVNPPFPIFNDVDGNPLEDGFIYIGTENLNAETNPISVYWDADLTIPAAQPIRTLGGYPSRAGTPARIFANSNYSMTVRNKNGTFIYSSASVTDVFSADLVNFIQSGTGAVTRTTQDKLRESYISVNDFGAIGNGSTDDREKIQNAIDAAYAAGIRNVLLNRNCNYRISSVHPSKTFTLPGDDGSYWNGASLTTTTAESVGTMSVGIWLPDGVNLVFEDDSVSIEGIWPYAITSPVNTSQVIGILVSSKTNASNPKSSTISSRITTLLEGQYGIVSNFMINVVCEGILASVDFNFSSTQSAFPFIAQGADNSNFNISTPYTKAGIIVGGQWLTMSNTTDTTHLPIYPAGFGTPGSGPATDVYLLGWCDNCSFTSQIQLPSLGGVGVAYSTFETNIDVFFDTYFFKSGSTSRLAASHDSTPANTTSYIGVVGNGVMVMSRYGRLVGTPKFSNLKNYGLLRNVVYVEQSYSGEVSRCYNEGVGNLNGVAFGVVTNDPYGSPGIATASYVRSSGTISIDNVFGFNSLVGRNVNAATDSYQTTNCFFASAGIVDLFTQNNCYGFIRTLLADKKEKDEVARTYSSLTNGRHSFPTIAQGNIFSVNLTGLIISKFVELKLRLTILESADDEAYCASYYEFRIPVGHATDGTIWTVASPSALVSVADSINSGVKAISATCQSSIVGSTMTVAITPTTTGVAPGTSAYCYWHLEQFGDISSLPITVL